MNQKTISRRTFPQLVHTRSEHKFFAFFVATGGRGGVPVRDIPDCVVTSKLQGGEPAWEAAFPLCSRLRYGDGCSFSEYNPGAGSGGGRRRFEPHLEDIFRKQRLEVAFHGFPEAGSEGRRRHGRTVSGRFIHTAPGRGSSTCQKGRLGCVLQ